MSKTKFKVGDRVVVTNIKYSQDEEEYQKYVGKLATVLEIDSIPKIKFDYNNKIDLFYQEELEFEEIYNTPLYRALSEK